MLNLEFLNKTCSIYCIRHFCSNLEFYHYTHVTYSKTCETATLKKTTKWCSLFKTNYRLMQVKSVAECPKEHSAILSTFIKLPFDIQIFVLSNFEQPFYTGFTVHAKQFYKNLDIYQDMHQIQSNFSQI